MPNRKDPSPSPGIGPRTHVVIETEQLEYHTHTNVDKALIFG